VWAPNGRELFFSVLVPGTADQKLMAVDIATVPTFRAGVPRALEGVVRGSNPTNGYDLAPDGQRFVTVRDNERLSEPPPAQMVLVQNWFQELRRLVPPK
jgi:hypothetical protein